MFQKIFESAPIRLSLAWRVDGSNNYLVTPPRIYTEDVQTVNGIFVSQTVTASGNTGLVVVGFNNMTQFNYFSLRLWVLDGETGLNIASYYNNAFVTTPTVGEMTSRPIGISQKCFQARDGNVWVYGASQLSMFECDATTFLATGLAYTSAYFAGRVGIAAPMVDKALDLCIMPSEITPSGAVSVYRLSTGARLRDIPTVGQITALLPEDARRCYAVTAGGLLQLIDYDRNVSLAVYASPVKAPAGSFIGPAVVNFAYDQSRKRLLAFGPVTYATDGACTATIKGYVPIPLLTNILTPIPLKPVRKGRTTPVLVRTCGDAGEAIGGQVITGSITGNATLATGTATSDSAGDAILRLTGTVAGTTTLTATTTL